jgi:pilus assembly protein Flp/PilA
MSTMLKAVRGFWKDEEGVTAIEYGLIAALIAVVIILAVTAVGGGLENIFNYIAGQLKT